MTWDFLSTGSPPLHFLTHPDYPDTAVAVVGGSVFLFKRVQ